MDSHLKIFAAPLQGYTEAPWRRAHMAEAGGVDSYFTPFVRWEKGAVRARDLRDVDADMSENVVPQAIFSNFDELRSIVDALLARGCRRIDLNMGCPFPLQTRRGRGAALVENDAELMNVCRLIDSMPDIEFSVKMRLGMTLPDSWQKSIDAINCMRLRHVTVHPRTAIQQYSGDLHLGQFALLSKRIKHPVVFNGNVASLADFRLVADRFPSLSGIMIGRGLLARPTLAREIITGIESTPQQIVDTLLKMHDHIYQEYAARLCGETQLLQKIKPFWEYPEATIGRRLWKPIHKATTLSKYLAAIDELRSI